MKKSEQTVAVRVRPEEDADVVILREEIIGLQRYADARVISCVDAIKGATDDLTVMSRLKKALEEKRKEYVGPLNEHVKVINSMFKSLSDPLEQADRTTRGKILAYNRKLEDDRLAAERAAQLEKEAAEIKARLAGEPPPDTTDIKTVETQAPVSKVYRDTGSLGMMMVRKWEVFDLSKVPLDYLMIDAAKVGKVVKAGVPSIPGIRIWLEESLRITTK